jgi:hypothetical protein
MSIGSMSDLRIHEVPQQTYFYHACRVTHDTISEAVAETMVALLDLTQARKIAATGNLLLVYRGNANDDGASRDIGETYGELIQHIRGAGLEPSGDIREEYLHWEGRQSDRDITWVQVGVRRA